MRASTQITAPPTIPQHLAPATSRFQHIPIAQVHESKLNPRKTFRPESLAELTISIRESGVWTPITVRSCQRYFAATAELGASSPVRYVGIRNIVGKTNLLETFSNGTAEENQAAAEARATERNAAEGYEIAAGHRRFRAAKAAGLTEIPAFVRELSDQQFAELVTFENLGREDVHPLEEATGFELLIERYNYTSAAIAEKVGCHESYVHKRLQLAKLTPAARTAFAEGGITLQHALQICRLDKERQKEAFDLCFRLVWEVNRQVKSLVSAKELDSRIREKLFLNLSAAPWNKHDEDLVPKVGACTNCPKRTGANHLLFDDVAKSDNCLDGDCFEAKRQAFVKITQAKHLRDTGKPMTKVATSWTSDLKKQDCLSQGSYHTIKAKSDRCQHVERAIVVFGENIGKVLDICTAAKCPKHGISVVRGQYGTYTKSAKEIAEEQKQKTDAKIDAAYRPMLWLKTWEGLKQDGDLCEVNTGVIADYLIERIGHDGRGPLIKTLGLTIKKQNGYADNSKALREFYQQLDSPQQIMFLVALATAPALGSMSGAGGLKQLEHVAAQLNIDHAQIKKEVSAPILAAAKKRADREEAQAKTAKPASKKAPPVCEAKRAAANDVEDDFEGSEECPDE